jgi:hypothetical protein
MKFRKKLGNESVQDLIREACARVAELPRVNLYEPWPSDRRLEVMAETESTPQDK